MTQHPVDVIIIGGGPGGSTLAGCLTQKNRSCLVFERETFPRFHIGESLLPRSCEVFQKLGVQDKLEQHFLRKYGARFLCSHTRRTNTYYFAEAFEPLFEYAFEVPRADFDHLLLEHAAELGAEVRQAWEVTEILFEGDQAVGVLAKAVADPGPAQVFRAKVVVDATGRDTLLAGKQRHKTHLPKLDKTAFFTHFKGAFREQGLDEGNIQIVVFEHGWFWFIPFRGEVSSVGAVVSSDWVKQRKKGESLDEFYARTVTESCWATEFLAHAERLRPVGALADFSYRIDQLSGNGWLFVGDSGGFLDPLFSTGAHMAMKGADIAADVIDKAISGNDVTRAAFGRYEQAARYAADLFLGFVQAFYGTTGLRDLLFQQQQKPIMRKLITSVLSGDVFHEHQKPLWADKVRELYPAAIH